MPSQGPLDVTFFEGRNGADFNTTFVAAGEEPLVENVLHYGAYFAVRPFPPTTGFFFLLNKPTYYLIFIPCSPMLATSLTFTLMFMGLLRTPSPIQCLPCPLIAPCESLRGVNIFTLPDFTGISAG